MLATLPTLLVQCPQVCRNAACRPPKCGAACCRYWSVQPPAKGMHEQKRAEPGDTVRQPACPALMATFRQTSKRACEADLSYGCTETNETVGRDAALWVAHGCRGTIDCGPKGRVDCGDWQYGRSANCSCTHPRGGGQGGGGARAVTLNVRSTNQSVPRAYHLSPRWWNASDWKEATAFAKDASRMQARIYARTREYVELLTAAPSSARYWIDGTVPPRRGHGPRSFRHACPSEFVTPQEVSSSPECDAFWPKEARTMYSIGIGAEWTYQAHALSRDPRLVVHAFDPTLQLRERHRNAAKRLGPRVRFHFAGLGGAAAGATQQESPATSAYGALAPSSLRPLRDLVRANPPGERRIDVLTIDCEGCEWAALEQVWRAGDASLLREVRLLLLEVHLSPTMVAPSPQQFANLFSFLLDELRFRLWFLRSNDGFPFDRRVVDFIGAASDRIDPGLCCYELGLVRDVGNLSGHNRAR